MPDRTVLTGRTNFPVALALNRVIPRSAEESASGCKEEWERGRQGEGEKIQSHRYHRISPSPLLPLSSIHPPNRLATSRPHCYSPPPIPGRLGRSVLAFSQRPSFPKCDPRLPNPANRGLAQNARAASLPLRSPFTLWPPPDAATSSRRRPTSKA